MPSLGRASTELRPEGLCQAAVLAVILRSGVSSDEMSTISEVQETEELDTKEHNKQDKHITEIKETDRTAKESDAARTLQRTFRGHRERRQLQGLSLDPSTRWIEVKYRLSHP